MYCILREKNNHPKINRAGSRKISGKMHLKINRGITHDFPHKTLTQDYPSRKAFTQDFRARPSRNITQGRLRKVKLG